VSPKNLDPAEAERVLGKAIDHEYSLAELLRRPDVSYAGLMSLDGGRYAVADLAADTTATEVATVVEQVEIAAKYSGYIDRQRGEIERAAHYENLKLPADLDYMQVTALSIEARQKLARHRPSTIAQAARLEGMTPAAILVLLGHLKAASAARKSA
jgi:tRNA uridine 5-carboxymethylaminomethyl modification enzyme